MLAVWHIDSHVVAVTRQLHLKVAAHAVEHLKLESFFSDSFTLGVINRSINHFGIVRRYTMIDARREQSLHHANVVFINILFVRESNFGRLVVSALADAYARRDFQNVLNVVEGSSEI